MFLPKLLCKTLSALWTTTDASHKQNTYSLQGLLDIPQVLGNETILNTYRKIDIQSRKAWFGSQEIEPGNQ